MISSGHSAAVLVSCIGGAVLLAVLVSLNLFGSFHPFSSHNTSQHAQAATISGNTSAHAPCTAAAAYHFPTPTNTLQTRTEASLSFEHVVPAFPESNNVIILPQLVSFRYNGLAKAEM
jgi:hypothetical protein